MPNDAKSKLDEATHALQDQPATRAADQHEATEAIGPGPVRPRKAGEPAETSKG